MFWTNFIEGCASSIFIPGVPRSASLFVSALQCMGRVQKPFAVLSDVLYPFPQVQQVLRFYYILEHRTESFFSSYKFGHIYLPSAVGRQCYQRAGHFVLS